MEQLLAIDEELKIARQRMTQSTPQSSKKNKKRQKNKSQQAQTQPVPQTKQSGSAKKKEHSNYEYLAKIENIDELVSQIESTQKKKKDKKKL